MYKTLGLLLLVAAIGIASVEGKLKIQSKHIQRAYIPPNHGDNPIDWCPQCINTWDELLEVALDVILQVGVLDSCGQLCDLVAKESGSDLLGFICTMGCDFLGLEEFSKLIEAADLDPIFYCEQMNLCPINDNGDSKFTSFVLLPPRAKTESTILLNMIYVSKNGTGTGEMVLTIETVDKVPLSAAFLMEAKKNGSYAERISIDTTPDPDCDPTEGECEMWLEGTYNVTVMLCNGQCGSHHPHTSVYDIGRGNFTLYEE